MIAKSAFDAAPTGWNRRRLATLFREVKEQGESDLPVLSVSIHHGISDRQLADSERDRKVALMENREKYRKVGVGDVAYNMMRAWQGAYGVARVDGLVSPAYVVATPISKIDGRYFDHLLRSVPFSELSKRYSKGITDFRLRLYWEEFRQIQICYPDLDTQKTIADFLDRETARIDQLIEKKEGLLGLFEEKRVATTLSAVSRGLNEDVATKQSSLPLGGQIPSHWVEQPLTTMCDFVQGKAHEPYFDEEGDFVCVTARFVSTNGSKRKHCTKNLTPARVDDIAMVMSDLPNGRALARAFLVDRDGLYAINQRVCAITVKRGNPRFFHYQLDRNRQLLRYDDGFNQTHLPNRAFKHMVLRVPPLSEQNEIADYLHKLHAQIGSISELTVQSLDRLREFRSALITAAVTGQIDVTTWGKQGSTDRRLDQIEEEMSVG